MVTRGAASGTLIPAPPVRRRRNPFSKRPRGRPSGQAASDAPTIRLDDTSLVLARRFEPDRMPNTSDIVMDTLERWGVDVVFGLPGDGINGLMEALRTRQDRIRFVLVRHEEAAAFAAAAYS